MEKKDMIKTSSKNYDFHYFKNSRAERDIEQIINLQEACFQDICEVLNINPKIRIQYYFLDTPKIVGEVYGDNKPCHGFAQAPNKIYAVYNDEIKCVGHHEDTHILSYTINRPKSNFIREGLAMFFDKSWWDKTNEDWIRLFLKEDTYIKINKLLDNNVFLSYSDAISYPIAGAFTKFLIDNYGIDEFLLLYNYKDENFSSEINNRYKKGIEEIEENFILSLKY